jgi:hypothetical protein
VLCTWTGTLLFGNFGGAGFNVAVLAGISLFLGCILQAQSIMSSLNGVGQCFFVGGGVMVIVGMDFRYVTAGLNFTGIGDFFVGAGTFKNVRAVLPKVLV